MRKYTKYSAILLSGLMVSLLVFSFSFNNIIFSKGFYPGFEAQIVRQERVVGQVLPTPSTPSEAPVATEAQSQQSLAGDQASSIDDLGKTGLKSIEAGTSPVASQVVIGLKDTTTPDKVAQQVGAKVLRRGPLQFATLAFEQGIDVSLAMEQLRQLPGVTSVQRNGLVRANAADVGVAQVTQITDQGYSRQWGLVKAKVPEAWATGATGEGITIAILDTGVDLKHPDLKNNLVPGYDARSQSADLGVGQDDNGHGTHVAGIAAAELNGIGVVGVAYQAKLMPVKVMDWQGEGTDDVIADGIVWAADHGARIINLSLGADAQEGILKESIAYAYKKGCLLVAAAGNFASGSNPGINYPAKDPHVLAVTATDQKDQIVDFSCTGSESVLAAPGINIYSDYWKPSGSTFQEKQGTSMAAPFVAGVGALVWSMHPTWTVDQVRLALENGAQDLGIQGRDDNYGYGRVNAYQSIIQSIPPLTLPSPATVTRGGALVQGGSSLAATLLIPAMAFTQPQLITVDSALAPANLPDGVLAGGTPLSLQWKGSVSQLLTLSVTAQSPAPPGYLGNLYHWSGLRWILVGGGVAANQITTGIYEPGIYQAGYVKVPESTRLAGENRQNTAIQISKAAFPTGADTVILARDDDFPDALTGVPLAYKLQAPILLTDSLSLSSEIVKELGRLAPQKVILLGTAGAIAEGVKEQLAALGYQTDRIAGVNRYETAAAIARTLGTTGKAFIVNGENFPDALAVSAQAAREGVPILLTSDSGLNSATNQVLRELSVTRTFIIGGEVRVSAQTLQLLPWALRLAGSDRYATGAAVLQAYPTTGPLIYVATGENFPDALAGGVLAARQTSNIVLVPPTGLTASIKDSLQHWQGRTAIALGSKGVVPESVLVDLQARIQ